MFQQFVVQPGDTLSKIAKQFYGDFNLAGKLADFNGIRNPDLIRVGQTIEIPSKDQLLGVSSSPAVSPAATAPPGPGGLATPNGLNEILTTFGNIFDFINEDGTLKPGWESDHLTRTPLPFPMPLSWDLSHSISKLYCHVKLADIFQRVFTEIQNKGLQSQVKTFGGCYNYRAKRTSHKLSAHSWGIAIDLNPDSNSQGTAGDIHPGVVQIFQSFGFKWGGEFSGPSRDPMHFQFCTGY